MEIITLTKEQLQQIITDTVVTTARLSVAATLESMGVRPRKDQVWMSQSEATRLIGRRRLEKAMAQGRVRWEKPDMSKKQGRVSVLAADVIKLIKEPK
mgnify:CR=1 FL=1